MTTRIAAPDRAPSDGALLEDIKISALTEGILVTEAAMGLLLSLDPVLTVHEYPTTGGLTLELPHEVYINAPFDEPYSIESTVVLDATRDGSLTLRHPKGEVAVERFLPLPGYLDSTDSHGRRVTDVAMSHADRVRLSPLAGCTYDCAFCDLPAVPYRLRSADQLLEALKIAQQDVNLPVSHALISGGSPQKRHYEQFEAVCREVIEAADVPVDLMMSPMRGNLGFIERLVLSGLQGFSINLEVFAEAASLAALPIKYRVTRPAFEEFANEAVRLLGAGPRVRSLIIPGLESIDDTLAGVDWLASMGCTPVLSPFRPGRGTAMAQRPPADPGEMRLVLDGAREIVAAHGVGLGPDCAPCQHNTLALPWDVR